jgi:hypothetical protein
MLVSLNKWGQQKGSDYYCSVDANELGERVGFSGADGPSPWWEASGREYAER